MTIDNQTLLRLAELSQLALRPDETSNILRSFNKLLASIEVLKDLDLSELENYQHNDEKQAPVRIDEVTEYPNPDNLQKIAPKTSHHYYLVPKVIEGEK